MICTFCGVAPCACTGFERLARAGRRPLTLSDPELLAVLVEWDAERAR